MNVDRRAITQDVGPEPVVVLQSQVLRLKAALERISNITSELCFDEDEYRSALYQIGSIADASYD